MLEIVGHPVPVNADRELARVAKEKGWEIRTFQQPVRLRDRVPNPPKAPTLAAAGVLTIGAIGAASYIAWRRVLGARV